MNQLTEMDLWNHKQAAVKIFLRLLARKCFQKKGFISSKDKKKRRLNVEFSISSAQITKLSSGLFASYLLTTLSKTLSRVRARGVCSWGGGCYNVFEFVHHLCRLHAVVGRGRNWLGISYNEIWEINSLCVPKIKIFAF